ncbi:hypothetical protein BDY24DRAFT_219945 [Mrakia frigida]|uniref:uncharacterized protein n=1 Tax=Mrakia frigida TaxID=29902 RepID=UPI003FCC03F6
MITTTTPSPRSFPSPSSKSKRTKTSSLSLSSLLLRAGILWFFTSLFLCSPTLTPETSTICYPASRYHSTLQPILQPHLNSFISSSQSYLSPYYQPHLHHIDSISHFVKPKCQSVSRFATPYIQIVQRGWIRLYRTHFAPRLHYGKLRLAKATRPYVRELELRWKHLVRPHLEKAQKSVEKVWKQVVEDERVKMVGKKGRELVKKALEGGKKAWEQGKPLAVKGWKEGRKQWTETVVPVGKKSYGLVKKHGYEGGVVASTYASHVHRTILTPASQKLHSLYLSKVYRPYLAQHIDPVIAKVSPVVSTIVHTITRIANPIIYHVGNVTSPIYHRYFPSTPLPPPTMLEKIQEKLSSFVPAPVTEEEVASHPVVTPAVVVPPATTTTASSATSSSTPSSVVEPIQEEEDDEEDDSFLAELESSSDPSNVEVPKHASAFEEEPVEPGETEEEERERLERQKEEVKEKRAEIERDHENWERKVKKVGEYEEGVVLEKLASTRSKAVSAFPSISRTWISLLEREANKISKSLDKFFARPTSANLTGAEIQAAVDKAGKRFSGKIEEVSEGVNGWLEGVESREEEIVQNSFEKVNNVASQATAELGMPYAWLDDVTVADWTRYHKLPQMALEWQDIYRQHAVSDSHPLLSTPETDMEKLVKEFKEEVEELEDGFAARIGITKNNAILKADAEERKARGLSEDDEDEEPLFSIGGIWGDAGDASEIILEKGKLQVLDALSSASFVVASSSSSSAVEPTPSSNGGFVEVASEAIFGAATTLAGNDDSHIFDQATQTASSLSSSFEAATTSAGNIVDQATETVSSLLSEASEAFETFAAHHPVVGSVVDGYEAVQEVRSEISEGVHEATRAVLEELAGGEATPTAQVKRDEL